MNVLNQIKASHDYGICVCVCVRVWKAYLVTLQTAIDCSTVITFTGFTHVLGPQRCTDFSVEQAPAPLTAPPF